MARSKRWVVDKHSPRELSQVLDRLGADPDAIAHGRVFVQGARVTSVHRQLTVGELIEVFMAGRQASGAQPSIAARRDDLVAADKPAGLPTIPDHRGFSSLQLWVAQQLGLDPKQVHATSRLDTDVSGVVVFALSAQARRMVQQARERGSYRRHYLAIATRAPSPPTGRIDAPIGRAADPRLRKVYGRDPAPSSTLIRLTAQCSQAAMVAVEPVTGRTHQIRVHMAHLGAPLLGDDRYGGPRSVVLPSGSVLQLDRIALHAAWVEISLEGAPLWTARSSVPPELVECWRALDGDPRAWDECLRGIEEQS